MIGTPARLTIRALFVALFFIGVVGTLGVVLPAGAGAYSTTEGPPTYSSASGLPDGRVYEQVSPANKDGNEAGAAVTSLVAAEQHYALAAPNGNSVLFEGTGAMGESPTAASAYFVASKNKSGPGWTTRALMPRAQQPAEKLSPFVSKLFYSVDPSQDLSRAMFLAIAGEYALPPGPGPGCSNVATRGYQTFLSSPDPFVPATWLERPKIDNPIYNCEQSGQSGEPVGGTPNFSTVYFTFPGTLLPEDASRAPHAHFNASGATEAWGFYEDREGVLREAGVLPDGDLDPFGAVPAVSGHAHATVGNQISADGSRAFFVSPDPASCEQNGGSNNCAVDPPELYVRESGSKTLLVSKDTLLPETGGLPAVAPDGVVQTLNDVNLAWRAEGNNDGSFVFASPDGSQAFFQSEDRLTSEAPEGPPQNDSPKMYDFDVDTGALTYLPGVVGQIVATDANGSSFAFVRPAVGSSPQELDLWAAGPGGGSVVPITQLPGSPGQPLVRMSGDGSVLVFLTESQLPGAFNSGGFRQIYRYSAIANTLGCVSCPPHGVKPTGDASMSPLAWSETEPTGLPELGTGFRGFVEERGMSSDGSRIFFDTPDPLVPQDTNTGSSIEQDTGQGLQPVVQGKDVYEWENGVVYLISSGKSPLDSFFLDNSENGDDVFFATAQGLVPGDTDGAYDVYDARVPQPGDNPPSVAVPCEGSICQGPPRVPSPLAAPASATFSGLGNPAPEPVVASPSKTKTTTKTIRCRKRYVKRKGRCIKQPRAGKSAKGKR